MPSQALDQAAGRPSGDGFDAATPSVSRKRIEQLDGLRAIAFLLVFLNHSIYLPMGWVGVDLFFVLSGFLITGILVDSRDRRFGPYIGNFYRRRAQRILPPYLLVLCVVLAIAPPPDWPDVWWQFFTFLQNFAVAYQRDVGTLAPYWSLAVEEQFYLLWPLVCFVATRRALFLIAVALVVLAPVARAIATPQVDMYTIIFSLTPFRADLLGAGALLALIWRDRPELLQRGLFWMIALLPIAAASFFLPALLFPEWRATANSFAFNVFGYSLDVLVFTLLLAVALAWRSPLLQGPLRHPAMVGLGRISYMCYLVHDPVLEYTMPMGRITGSLVGFLITILIATLSWRLIEAPILGWRRLEKAEAQIGP